MTRHIVVQCDGDLSTSTHIKGILGNIQYYHKLYPIGLMHLIVGNEDERVSNALIEFADLNSIPIDFYSILEFPLLEELVANSNGLVLFYRQTPTDTRLIDLAVEKQIPVTVWNVAI